MNNDFNKLLRFLQHQTTATLPGMDAQLLLAPPMRSEELKRSSDKGPKRQSAVVILLFEEAGCIKVLMMKRSSRLHHHAGQISFPGGQIEKQDANGWDTAIRETEEETGIQRKQIRYIAQLSDLFIPPSNFNVEVYVGSLDFLPQLSPSWEEVDELLKIPLSTFMDMSSVQQFRFRVDAERIWEAPSYVYKEHRIWGASAMMMSEFIELIKKMPV